MESLYDRALLEVGQDGVFQKKFDLIYNVFLGAFWAMAYMNIFLVLVVTPHWCHIPEKPQNISEFEWKMKHIPISENISGHIKFDSCKIIVNNSNIVKDCDKYDYDKTWFESTVPSENNWVCGNEIKVANVFAYSRIGEVIGSIVFGWFGDTYGRRLTYIISLALIIIGRFISVLANQSFLLFVCGCIISCLPSWSVLQSTTVISIEISTPKRRTTTATLRFVAWSLGMCAMAFLYWWLRTWKLFTIVTTLTQLPYLIFSWTMIESPRWLWIEGKGKECIRELKVIAKVNKTKLQAETEQELLTISPKVTNQTFGPLALFTGWKLTITTVLQLYLWIAVSSTYTVFLLTSGEDSEGNPFTNFAWQSAAELPGNFIGAWLADRIGRRFASASSFATTATMWILITLHESSNYSWVDNSWLKFILIIIGRLSTTVSYYMINLFNMELYPTSLRQSGMSLGNVFSSGASAMAPYILYMGRQVDSRLPNLILSGISILAVVSSLLLPETLNAKLPENLEDAKHFGKDYRKYFSLLKKHQSTQEGHSS